MVLERQILPLLTHGRGQGGKSNHPRRLAVLAFTTVLSLHIFEFLLRHAHELGSFRAKEIIISGSGTLGATCDESRGPD
jgi:hypothetical protein